MRRFAVSVIAALFALSATAEAKKPEDVFAGKIITSDQAFPVSSKSANAYIQQVKKLSKSTFQENKEEKSWKIYYAAFFRKPVNDLEVTVNLYDVSDGSQRLVESYQQYLTRKGDRAVIGHVTLNRSDTGDGYPPNSRIYMEMLSKGRVVASTTFTIAGEAKRYKGKVEFSEEEAKGGQIQDDDDAPPPPAEKPQKSSKSKSK